MSWYRFYLNDSTLVKNGNDNQYAINNVQRSQHYGKYKCVPRNDVGDGPEAAVILNVNGELYHWLIYHAVAVESASLSSTPDLLTFLNYNCEFISNPSGERS